MPTVPTPHDHALPIETLDEKAARLNPLGPLRAVIARTMLTTPVTLGPGGADALVDELTLAVALYTAREVLPAGLLGAADPAADEPGQRPAPLAACQCLPASPTAPRTYCDACLAAGASPS